MTRAPRYDILQNVGGTLVQMQMLSKISERIRKLAQEDPTTAQKFIEECQQKDSTFTNPEKLIAAQLLPLNQRVEDYVRAFVSKLHLYPTSSE
jgi:hypothetical protein